MEKIKKIAIYTLLFVFVLQNTLFNYVYASESSTSCVESAINKSCEASGMGFVYDKNKDCCVCENSLQDLSCSHLWPGYGDNGKWCCVYSCSACYATPTELQKYINFQISVFQILKDAQKKFLESNLVKKQKAWLFSSWILKIANNIWTNWKSMFQKITSEFKKTLKSTQFALVMIKSMAKDSRTNGLSLFILFNERPFVRDWATLMDVEFVVNDFKREFNMEWFWDKEISVETRKSLDDLISKIYLASNANRNALFDGFYFQWTVKYSDIINMQSELNLFMKGFLSNYYYKWTIEELDDEMKKMEKRIKKNNVILHINRLFIEKLHDSYKCAGANGCEWLSLSVLTNLLPNIKNAFSESMMIIKTANLALGNALPKNKKKSANASNPLALTDKQIELLRTVYGVDTTQLVQQEWIWLDNFWKVGQNVKKTIHIEPLDIFSIKKTENVTKTKNISNQVEQDKKFIAELDLNDMTEKEQEIYNLLLTESSDSDVAALNWILLTTLDLVIDEKNKSKNSILYYSVVTTMSYNKEISTIIHTIIDDYIWTKNSKGLVDSLWQTCSLQCTNAWIKNCYFNN